MEQGCTVRTAKTVLSLWINLVITQCLVAFHVKSVAFYRGDEELNVCQKVGEHSHSSPVLKPLTAALVEPHPKVWRGWNFRQAMKNSATFHNWESNNHAKFMTDLNFSRLLHKLARGSIWKQLHMSRRQRNGDVERDVAVWSAQHCGFIPFHHACLAPLFLPPTYHLRVHIFTMV